MNSTDRLVLQALGVLIQEHGEDTVIPQQLVSDRAEISLRTTKRSLKRLMGCGAVVGQRSIPAGYKYRIANGSPRRND